MTEDHWLLRQDLAAWEPPLHALGLRPPAAWSAHRQWHLQDKHIRAARVNHANSQIAMQIWLMLTMSAIFLVPALLVSVWFAGLYPGSPYRERLYT